MCSSIRQILKSCSTPHFDSTPIWDKSEPTFLDHSMIIEPRNDKEQQIQVVNNLLKVNNFDYIVCTDGSTIKNESKHLGKTGFAAVIYHSSVSSAPHIVSAEVGLTSHNYIGKNSDQNSSHTTHQK